MIKYIETKKHSLVLLNEAHEEAYIQMMGKRETIEENIQPELLNSATKFSDKCILFKVA